MAESNKLAVIVHHNGEVTVRDERGYPLLCQDCRYSGWLTEYERHIRTTPATCLRYSGGADVSDGDRVLFDEVKYDDQQSWKSEQRHNAKADYWRARFPRCIDKNPTGNCEDFVRAKPLPWWGNFWKKLFRREWRTRKMRL